MNAFTVAATALLLGFVPCLFVIIRASRAADGVVALELCGALATMIFLCLSLGLGESSYFDVPVISALVTWIGGLVYVRLLGRDL